MRRLSLVFVGLLLLVGLSTPVERAASSFDPSAHVLTALRPVTLEAFQQRANVRLVAPYRVTVGATAVQLTSSGNVHGIVIKAISPGQTIYLGVSSAVTTSTGYPLSDGETLTLEVRNANEIYAIASAAAQSVSVLPFARY